MEKGIISYLKEEINKHPQLQPVDVFKFVYQAVFGPAHLNTDKNILKKYLLNEFENIKPQDVGIVQEISNKYCRVNLSSWKFNNFSIDNLFDLFVQSIHNIDTVSYNNDTVSAFFKENIDFITNNFSHFFFSFNFDEWTSFVESYDFSRMDPVSHSSIYKSLYYPSYRVICKELLQYD